MICMRDIMCKSGMFSVLDGYHEYNKECSIHWRDIMNTVEDTRGIEGTS